MRAAPIGRGHRTAAGCAGPRFRSPGGCGSQAQDPRRDGVRAGLRADPDRPRIGIAVTDSIVMLTGAVNHPEARKAVEHGVRSVAQGRTVVNRIQIAPEPRSAVAHGGCRPTDAGAG
ncbi:BON domain-containing protein [Methylobacterium sp. P31]